MSRTATRQHFASWPQLPHPGPPGSSSTHPTGPTQPPLHKGHTYPSTTQRHYLPCRKAHDHLPQNSPPGMCRASILPCRQDETPRYHSDRARWFHFPGPWNRLFIPISLPPTRSTFRTSPSVRVTFTCPSHCCANHHEATRSRCPEPIRLRPLIPLFFAEPIAKTKPSQPHILLAKSQPYRYRCACEPTIPEKCPTG